MDLELGEKRREIMVDDEVVGSVGLKYLWNYRN